MNKRPNIVIVNPDHYRGEALGHLGHACVQTPNLDRAATQEGVSFSQAFCQNPVCTPSRCSFMTGWYPHVRGHRTMFHMLQPDEPDLMSRLKAAGYFVWWGGKNDLVPREAGFGRQCDVRYRPPHTPISLDHDWREPNDPGFFSFYYGRLNKGDDEVYFDADWADVLGAIEQIRNLPEDRPFCINLSLRYPHPPFAVEEPFFSMIDRAAVPPRIPPPEGYRGKASMLRGIAEASRLQDWPEENWNEMRAVFYAMCSRVDHQFGLILEALQQSGVYDDTAIFFFSDHGMYAGDYGLVDINQNTFEDVLTRVPLVFKPPAGIPVDPGVSDALVELVDLTATVEDVAGLPPSHWHFGRSLLPVAADRTREHRDAVFCEGGRLHGERHCMELEYEPGHTDPDDIYYPRLHLQAQEGPEHTKAVMCRTDDFKYVRRLYEQDELYDLRADPQERRNRIDDPLLAADLQYLRERLLRWYMETCDAVPLQPNQR